MIPHKTILKQFDTHAVFWCHASDSEKRGKEKVINLIINMYAPEVLLFFFAVLPMMRMKCV